MLSKNSISLTEMIIPSSLNKIDDGTFYDYKIMEKINFPSQIESFGSDSFFGTGVADNFI